MKKREKKDERENYFDVFVRNWRNVPGFRSLIQLILWGLFFFIFIVVVNLAGNPKKNPKPVADDISSSPVTQVETITYGDILDNAIKSKKDIYISMEINGVKSRIDAITTDKYISGYFETDKLTKKFKIENNILYEVSLDHEIENDKVLNGLNLDFIIPSNLIALLKNNIPTKMINNDEVLHNYDIMINNIAYKVTTTVKESILTKITIVSEKENYTILYE